MRVTAISTGLFAVVVSACNNLPTQSDRAALIATPTPASHAEVSAVLAEALGPREILLAEDVLTRSSILTLERGGGLDPVATGRNLEMPERFELVLNGNRCFLVRASTGDRWALSVTDCVVAER